MYDFIELAVLVLLAGMFVLAVYLGNKFCN